MIDHDFSDEQRSELGDLQPLYQRLQEYEVSEPDSARLLAALTPLLPKQTAESSIHRRGFGDWLRLAWAQTELLEAPFWWASALLTLVGVWLGFGYHSDYVVIFLILLSPLLAVAGVAYIFRPATRTLWDLERLSSVQPFELLYARLALILMWNIGLALALLLAAWSQGFQVVLWRLLLIWFGPMIGLTGIALFCSVRWNTFAGIVTPMLVWAGMIFFGWRETVINTRFDLLTASNMITYMSMSNTLLGIALLSLTAGVILLVASGRTVIKWA